MKMSGFFGQTEAKDLKVKIKKEVPGIYIYTKLATNKDILNLVKSINPSESILFADKILKFNEYKMK